jgi:regulatory protein
MKARYLHLNFNIEPINCQHLAYPLNIGTEKAWEKIRKFCAYRERNHKETKEKLYSYGLYPNQVEELIGNLISEGYLNEERYAMTFSHGKFAINGWGKDKIRFELKKDGISTFCIKKGISAIDEEEYEKKAARLMEEKFFQLQKEKNTLLKEKKIWLYLRQKGYESELIQTLLKTLKNRPSNGK